MLSSCEIGLQRGLVEVITLLAQLLGVIAPVPGRQLEIAAFLGDQRLQRVAFFQRARLRAGAQTFPAARGPAPACRPCCRPVCRRQNSHSPAARAFSARSASVSAMMALLLCALALSPRATQALNNCSRKAAVVGELQEGLDAGARQGDGIGRVQPALLGGGGRRVAQRIAAARQSGFRSAADMKSCSSASTFWENWVPSAGQALADRIQPRRAPRASAGRPARTKSR